MGISGFGRLRTVWFMHQMQAEVGCTLRQELWGLSNHLPPFPCPVLSFQGCYHCTLYLFSVGFKHNFFRHGFCLPLGQLHLPTVLSVLVASGTDCGTQRVTVGQSTGLRHICPSLAGSAFPAPLAGTSAGWELWGAEILNALWQE